MNLLILYVFLAVSISFLCSILEAVILSVTPGFIITSEQQEKKYAPQLKAFKNDIDSTLAGILTINTIANTAGATGAGAQAQLVFGDIYFTIFTGVLTLVILIFSEIVPKSLGALYWRQLAPITTLILRPIAIITFPFTKLSTYFTQRFTPDEAISRVNLEEFDAMTEVGGEEGVFSERDATIIRNLIHLKNIEVGDIMTPRTVLFTLKETDMLDDVKQELVKSPFSRIPVYGTHKDDINGYIFKNHALVQLLKSNKNKDKLLEKFKRPILTISQYSPVNELFYKFLDQQEHIAVVINEHGAVEGVVTMEDILETLLGLEIVDEGDKIADLREFAKQLWKVRAKQIGVDLS